jgi:SAM-dependent methyltransferase
MSDSVCRFSSRVDDYAKYRPGYPSAVVDILRSGCGLTETATIADLGSGTGILSELWLKNGNPVSGIEPNAAMRQAAERLLTQFPNFASLDATAEATTLMCASIDFVTAGQAFHWFNQEKTKRECARILKPGGWVVLIWNERRLDSTPFLAAYERLLLEFGTDYERVRHENVAGEIAEFYAPESFHLKSLENFQYFDLEGLAGRTRSASYTPQPGQANFAPLYQRLAEIFKANESGGKVAFEYDTRVYYGHIAAPS